MFELLNTLYVLTPGASLHLNYDTVRVIVDGQQPLRVPLLRLVSIVTFGPISVSPHLMHRCAEDGRPIVLLSSHGRFKARLTGPTQGNVLLRRSQHLALSDPQATVRIARQFVASKIQNSRQVLLRGARDSTGQPSHDLRKTAEQLAEMLTALKNTENLDQVRGAEGESARAYFASFNNLLRKPGFRFPRRSRRPPRDPINCLLSFLYALLREECVGALESVGLDPQVGYLHALRPGRPALALDLMEEFRALAADRLAVTLINRMQIQPRHFQNLPGGAVHLTDQGRRKLLSVYQERKKRQVEHRLAKRKTALGLVPHIQARLLARHLRGDLAHYPAYVAR